MVTTNDQSQNQLNISRNIATIQMSMKKGLHTFGKAGCQAMGSEMKQLHDRQVMKPIKEEGFIT